MFLTVGMTLGIRVPVVGPLKDINFQKHSGAPLAVLVYIYIYFFLHIFTCIDLHDSRLPSSILVPVSRPMVPSLVQCQLLGGMVLLFLF